MTREEFIADLATLIRPRAPLAAALELGKMIPFLTDIADAAFTPEALTPVAAKLKRSPNLGEVRAALANWNRVPAKAPSSADDVDQFRRHVAARGEALRAEWDDRDGIRRRIRDCDGDPRLLRLLGGIVNRWAPQHLGEIPPAHWPAQAALDGQGSAPGR
jgi:hypothetical protein